MKVTQATIALLFFFSISAHADVMLLIHGYLGDANSWEKSGINTELHQQGGQRTGMFKGSPQGPRLFVTKHATAKNIVYVAELPSNTPVMAQADVLKNIIDIIQQNHNNEKI